jgi:hypothetical protein
MAWERFNTLLKIGPDLAIPNPILLQHFYMGLNRKTLKLLSTALGGSFLHVSTDKGRSILTKILEDIPEEVEEKSLEEESQVAKPESLPDPSQASAIPDLEPLKKEETPISDFMLEFEDELFTEYGNTSNYHTMRKPQKPRKLLSIEPLDPSEEAFLKNTTKELVSIISNEWLVESKLSHDVICLDSPSISIRCKLTKLLLMLFIIQL